MKFRAKIIHLLLLIELIGIPHVYSQSNFGQKVTSAGKTILGFLGGRNSGVSGQQAELVNRICPIASFVGPVNVPLACSAGTVLSADDLKKVNFYENKIQKAEGLLGQCPGNIEPTLRELIGTDIQGLEEKKDELAKFNRDFFKNLYQQLRDPIKREYDFLYKGDSRVGELFSQTPSCKNIGSNQDFVRWGRDGGLFAIVNPEGDSNTGKLLSEARTYKSSDTKENIDNYINQAVRRAKKNGMYSFASGNGLSVSGYPEIGGLSTTSEVLSKAQEDYSDKITNYRNDLNKYLDPSSEIDAPLFQALTEGGDSVSLTNTYKQWYSNKQVSCLYGSIDNGREGFYEIFNNVRHNDENLTAKERNNRKTKDATATSAMAQKIEEVLSRTNGQSMKSKIREIQNFAKANNYMNTKVTAKIGGTNRSENPVKMLMRVWQSCTSGSRSASRGSRNIKIGPTLREVKKISNQIIADKNAFAGEIEESLRGALVSCEGVSSSKKGRTCSPGHNGNKGPFAVEGNFCLANANKCNNAVESCIGAAEQTYKNRKEVMRGYIKEYNSRVENHLDTLSQRFDGLENLAKGVDQKLAIFGLSVDKSGDGMDYNSYLNNLKKGKYESEFDSDEYKKELGEDQLLDIKPEDVLEDPIKNLETLITRLKNTEEELKEKMEEIIEQMKAQVDSMKEGLKACEAAKTKTSERLALCNEVNFDSGPTTDEIDEAISNTKKAGVKIKIPSEIEEKVKIAKEADSIYISSTEKYLEKYDRYKDLEQDIYSDFEKECGPNNLEKKSESQSFRDYKYDDQTSCKDKLDELVDKAIENINSDYKKAYEDQYEKNKDDSICTQSDTSTRGSGKGYEYGGSSFWEALGKHIGTSPL